MIRHLLPESLKFWRLICKARRASAVECLMSPKRYLRYCCSLTTARSNRSDIPRALENSLQTKSKSENNLLQKQNKNAKVIANDMLPADVSVRTLFT